MPPSGGVAPASESESSAQRHQVQPASRDEKLKLALKEAFGGNKYRRAPTPPRSTSPFSDIIIIVIISSINISL